MLPRRMSILVPGNGDSAGLVSLLAVLTWPRLEVLPLLAWKNDVQLKDSRFLQEKLACPVVEARARDGWPSSVWSSATGEDGETGSC